jgi:positive regulator of sigma E activity
LEGYKVRVISGPEADRVPDSDSHTRYEIILPIREGFHMTIRLILLIPLLAYVGFLWAGQGSRSFNSNTIIGALLGAVLGFCLAFIFTRRARRKRAKVSNLLKPSGLF